MHSAYAFSSVIKCDQMKSSRPLLLLAVSAMLFMSSIAIAQSDYPSKPIRMIIPFPPGGGTDIVSRQVAAKMSEGLGRQVIVDNRPGAGGTLGAELGVNATPDGYTIVMISAAYSANPSLYKLPYDPVNGIAAISMVGTGPLVVVLHSSLLARNIGELIAYAKANPGKLNYGTAGQGGLSHLATELFKLEAGVDMVHVPYRGTGPAITDLLGGRLQLMFGTIVPVMPHVKTGRLRGIAVTTAARVVALPDVPTVAEAGIPGYEAVVWFGVWAPPKVSKAIIKRLNDEIRRVVPLPEIRERLALEGLDAAASTPEEFTAWLSKDVDKWARVVKAAGIRPE
jgi:tripartite-type tricarboxylate transporter receptor subunit TctC